MIVKCLVYEQTSDVHVSVRNQYENNDSGKQRQVVVLTLHIECNFNLKVFFFFITTLFPVHYQPSRDSKLL